MPLTRGHDSIISDDPEGIAFLMSKGVGTVQCLLTKEALADNGARKPSDHLPVFLKIREDAERVASRKFDRGEIRQDGCIVIRGADLNPEKYTP